jgi:hypothetical protein
VRIALYVALAAAIGLAQAAPARAGSMNGIPGPLDVSVVHGECPFYADGGSCADPVRAIVYLDTDDEFTRQHELGHLYDAQRLDAGERAALARSLDVPARTPWDAHTGPDCVTTTCPSERFADAYGTCRLGWTPDGEWADAYGYDPTARTHRRVCAAIRRYGDV